MTKNVENHLSIRTTRFFLKIIGMWYTNNEQERLVANLLLSFMMINLISSVVIVLLQLWNSWGDLAAVSYSCPCTTSAIQELVKLSLFIYYRRRVIDFNIFTEKTFWNVEYDKSDLDILENCNKTCLWAYAASFLLMQTIACCYMSIPIIENLSRNGTSRELPFRLGFDSTLTVTPWFEITFFLETAAASGVGVSATTFAVFLFTINQYAVGQFKILQRKLERSSDVLNDESNDRLNNSININKNENLACENLRYCVKQHQTLILYIEKVENLYSYILLGQTLVGVSQICFSSFQIVLGAQESLRRTGLSIVFLVGSTIQLFLTSWSCHSIIEESLEIAEAAYRASWYDLNFTKNGKIFRRGIFILMCRARKPCSLSVGKFTPMSLQTFAAVFNTSLSYFTVLRQMQEE